jgi:hypothetical protein
MAKRPYMTTEDKALIWQRWHDGVSMSEISRQSDKSPLSVFGYLRQFGGIEPAIRTRSQHHLSAQEGE